MENIRNTASDYYNWFTTPTEIYQLSSEDRKVLDAVWQQFQALGSPLKQTEVASGIHLAKQLKPGRYSKQEVSELTGGALKVTIAISERGDLYFLPKKRGKLLGKGAVKTVYEGYKIAANHTEAIADLTVKDELAEAQDESRLATLIDSPYVMGQSQTSFDYTGNTTIEGKKVKQKKLFMAQEKMDGTLKSLLENPLTSNEERLDALIQTTKGLRDMHTKGIAHRDLHNENILYRHLDGKLEVKISDLGVAKENGVAQGAPSDICHLGNHIERAFFKNGMIRPDLSSEAERQITALYVTAMGDSPEPQPSAQEVLDRLEALAGLI